ncbi:hypothetical protein D2Q93_07910 [Alicyclobacillaceae bacterium I2511]|nr:hypothetical protein D2Q93_07910 [Alicyclobacillaceae bacterium I2511]
MTLPWEFVGLDGMEAVELPAELLPLDEVEALVLGVETGVLLVPTPAPNPVSVELVVLVDGEVPPLADEFGDDGGMAEGVLQPVRRAETKPALITV